MTFDTVHTSQPHPPMNDVAISAGTFSVHKGGSGRVEPTVWWATIHQSRRLYRTLHFQLEYELCDFHQ